MIEPQWIPALSAAAASGGALAARDYLRRRLVTQEDRFMALYSADEWERCNMDILFHFDPERDEQVKAVFRDRLARLVAEADPSTSLFHEVGHVSSQGVSLHREARVDLDRLSDPERRGLRLDWETPGQVKVVWNHVQTDGVGLWESLRAAFDPSPPLVTYQDVATPPPFLPELLALPAAMRRLAWRGKLEDRCGEEQTTGVHVWPTEPIRELKNRWKTNFNLVTAALLVRQVFDRHPEVPDLCVGILVFFPFLKGRNRYGVMILKVKRDSVEGLLRQIERQVRFPMMRWGVSSAQTYTLSRLPEVLFDKVMRYYRRQVDVLISNLPVGTTPASLDGESVTISCHPWEMGAPYYLLLVGTRDTLHLSMNSRFREVPDFMARPL